jgi:hypothetical protein
VTPLRGSGMSTKYVRTELSAQNFHPEFGYFCPSARMQRKLRSAAMTVVLAGLMLAAGAAVGLQLAPSVADDDVGQPVALPAVASRPLDQAGVADAARIADESVPAVTAQAAPMTGEAAPSRPQTSCDDLSGSFLAPQCQLGKAGKHQARAARAAHSRVATIPIGRPEASLEVGQQESEAPQSAPAAQTAATVATNEVPPGPSDGPAKKPVKITHKQPPNREIASSGPSVAPSTAGFDLFALFHEPTRTGNGVWAMSW